MEFKASLDLMNMTATVLQEFLMNRKKLHAMDVLEMSIKLLLPVHEQLEIKHVQ